MFTTLELFFSPHFKLRFLFCLVSPEFTIVECRGLHTLLYEGEEVSAEGGKGAWPHLGVAGREDLLHRRVHSALRVGQEDRGAGRGFEGEGDRSLPAIGESLISEISLVSTSSCCINSIMMKIEQIVFLIECNE